MTSRLILFGAPGAGKGTLAERVKQFSKIAHISTGDLFRENIKAGTPIGKEAKQYIDNGQLVPDSVVIGMVQERLKADDVKAHGFMLDGFPRTMEQAKQLDAVVSIDTVAVLDIEKDVLKKRIIGRWNCPSCNRIYNVYNPALKPKVDGACDDCKVALVHRSDDNEETFEKRWNTFLDQSSDVIAYYEKRPGLVVHLDALKTLDYTDDELHAMLKV